MKKKNLSFLLLLLFSCTLLFWSCSTTKVIVDPSHPSVQLSDYDTFNFVGLEAEGDTASTFDENMAYFKSEVVKQMSARGLSLDSINPDLKVNLGIKVEEKTQTRQTSLSDPGEWTYIGQRNYKWESKTVEVGTYKMGSVTIHLVDNISNEAVWVGLIEGILPRRPEKTKSAISDAVTALFSKIDQEKNK